MEADWEIEVAPDAPVIDAAWNGFVDLRRQPEKAGTLPEAKRLPVLLQALVRLNGPESPLWTAKCDVWTPDEFDADELDAPHDSANEARACYIDMLARNEQMWDTIDSTADWCRRVCVKLRTPPHRQCRSDLIVRRAMLTPDRAGLGVTGYLTGCGPDAADALRALSEALLAFADTVSAPTP